MVEKGQNINGMICTKHELWGVLKSYNFNGDGKITRPEMIEFLFYSMSSKTGLSAITKEEALDKKR